MEKLNIWQERVAYIIKYNTVVWRKGEVCTRFWWGNLRERAPGEIKT